MYIIIYRSTSKGSVVMASLDGLVGHKSFFDGFGGPNTDIPLIDDDDFKNVEGGMNVSIIPRVRRVKKSKCTTDIDKKKALEVYIYIYIYIIFIFILKCTYVNINIYLYIYTYMYI
jgi:hypothetical protein